MVVIDVVAANVVAVAAHLIVVVLIINVAVVIIVSLPPQHTGSEVYIKQTQCMLFVSLHPVQTRECILHRNPLKREKVALADSSVFLVLDTHPISELAAEVDL